MKTADINSLIIGAVISIVATNIGYIVQTVIRAVLDNRGKVNVRVKSVYSKMSGDAWGFNSDGVFEVPLWLELCNTKNKNEIVRNMNLQLYLKGKKVGETVQCSHFELNNNKEPYGNNGTYSFMIEPITVSKYDLYFCAKPDVVNSDFDEVRISYFDSKDRYKECKLFDIENCWKKSNNKIDNDWRLLK
ncbi:hypothetical protein OZX60_03205 [Streptococcaceae bacterium ESL0687]|nr:hypothetical protein OZX60_03205 [Streptococcaceae bacterium ESL0687]